MRRIVTILLLVLSIQSFGQTLTPRPISSRDTWTGSITDAWFLVDLQSPASTRKVAGSTVLQTAVKYLDTAQMLAPYALRSWVSANFYPLNSNPSGYLVSSDLGNYYTKAQADAKFALIGSGGSGSGVTPSNIARQYLTGYGGFATLSPDSILLTGYSASAGTVSASDNIRIALQKLDGNIQAANTALAGKQAAGSYVPTSLSITINGITQDLSQNRSWTISGGGGSGLSYPNVVRQYLTGYGAWATLNADSITGGSTNKFLTLSNLTSILPSQTGNAGKFLSQDGNGNYVWSGLASPNQVRKYLTGYGTWADISPDSSVIANYIAGAGTVANGDNVKQALQKLDGNIQTNTVNITSNTNNINSYLVSSAVYTSGATYTVPNNTTHIVINPSATVSTLTATLPATPLDGQTVVFSFGGALTSGTIVSGFAVSPNTSQSIVGASSFTGVQWGEEIGYRWVQSLTKWYRVNF